MPEPEPGRAPKAEPEPEPRSSRSTPSDSHVSLVVVFTVPQCPEDKMEAFVNNFPEFYNKTRVGTGTEDCLLYGFAINGRQVTK